MIIPVIFGQPIHLWFGFIHYVDTTGSYCKEIGAYSF